MVYGHGVAQVYSFQVPITKKVIPRSERLIALS